VRRVEDKKKYVENIMIDLGLMHDRSEMIDDERIAELVGGLKEKYYGSAMEYGERAFRAVGNKRTLIVWDCGNSWYQIVKEEIRE